MNARTARNLLRLYRPDADDDADRAFREAVKIAEKAPELHDGFERQVAFDRALVKRLEIPVPADAAAQLAGYREKFLAKRRRFRFSLRDPAVVAVGFSFLVLLGLLVWVFLGRINGFAGLPEAVALARSGDKAGAQQFDPLAAKAGTLGDWFILQGFEGFKTPAGFEDFDVVGVRLFNHETESIAAAAVPAPGLGDGRAFFYMFAGAPLGISVEPEGSWRIAEYGEGGEKRTLGIREKNGMCFMIASKGTRGEMERFIRTADGQVRSD